MAGSVTVKCLRRPHDFVVDAAVAAVSRCHGLCRLGHGAAAAATVGSSANLPRATSSEAGEVFLNDSSTNDRGEEQAVDSETLAAEAVDAAIDSRL